jgi:non-specific serine/threonine protein kinase
VAQDGQEVELALDCFERAEALYARGGDRRGIAVSIGSRAHLARQQGNPREALELFHKALAVFREVGDPRAIANCLANLGHAVLALGEPRRSLEYFREAIELRRALGDMLGIAECLEGFGAASAITRQSSRAARLLGAAASLRESTGAPLSAAEREQYEIIVQRIRQRLDLDVIAREEAIGGALVPAQAIDYALLDEPEPMSTRDVLTRREREIANLVAQGLTNRQIADRLLLTRRTVGTHLEHIFAKLGVQARAEVAVWITRHGDSR